MRNVARKPCLRAGQWGILGILFSFITAASAADSAVLLHVEGAVRTPLALTAEGLAHMPRVTARFERDGETATYEGVLLYDNLLNAGIPFGKDMTGKPMASYILATARDGYQVVFAIPEIDPAFSGARVLIADKRDGGPLQPVQRPLQMIAARQIACAFGFRQQKHGGHWHNDGRSFWLSFIVVDVSVK